MAINHSLTARVREALSSQKNVEEKKMFRDIAFMVNGKLCVTAGDDEIMLRIDPALNDEVLQKPGTKNMIMKGKELKGWVYVKEEVMKNKKEFDNWLKLALAFNAKAKASKRKK